jgi:hypothetical protein
MRPEANSNKPCESTGPRNHLGSTNAGPILLLIFVVNSIPYGHSFDSLELFGFFSERGL